MNQLWSYFWAYSNIPNKTPNAPKRKPPNRYQKAPKDLKTAKMKGKQKKQGEIQEGIMAPEVGLEPTT